MDIDPRKVAVYIRWSTDEQTDGTTLEVQTEGCRHYLASQGWFFSEGLCFVDEGYSGGSLDRPALTKLRKAVKEGLVDCVVVFKLDRLSRNVLNTVQLVLEEWDGICHIKSAREPVDTTSAMGKQFFYMLVSYAEWERAVIKERTFSGKLKRATQGRNPGRPIPYGYRIGESPGTLVIDEEEAEVVRDIYSMYARNIGVSTIARILTERGFARPNRSGAWFAPSVMYILKNPLYKGELVYGVQTRSGKRKGIQKTAGGPLSTIAGVVPPIVDEGLWSDVQRVRAERGHVVKNTSGRSVSSRHLLSGIAKCTCGYSYVGQLGAHGKRWYYVCDGVRRYGAKVCNAGMIPCDDVDSLVVERVMRQYSGEGVLRAFAEREAERRDAVVAELRREVVRLTGLVRGLEEQDARNRKAFRLGEITGTTYEMMRAEIEADRKRYATLIEEANVQIAGGGYDTEGIVRAIALLDSWASVDIPQRKHILRALIRRLVMIKPKGGSDPHIDLDLVME